MTYEWRPAGPSVISTKPVWSMKLSAKTRTWMLTVIDNGALSDVKSFTFTALP